MGGDGSRVREKFLELLLALAVNWTVVLAPTAEFAVAEKVVEVEPDPTVTEAGVETAELFLDIETAWPPLGAGPLSVTVHVDEAGGVIEDGLQLRLLTVTEGGGGCETVTVPVLPEEVMLSPAAFEATVLVI